MRVVQGPRLAEATCFEVLDLFEGFATLVRRSPTLDGSVPVRVAQACLPLLEGNAFGLQVVLDRELVVRSRLGRVALDDPSGDLAVRHAAALPRLVAHSLLARDGAWERALRAGFAWSAGRAGGRPRVRLFTGLLVRPDAGTWLRVSATANRRSTLFDVDEVYLADDGAFVPLVLTLSLPPRDRDGLRLAGEVATLAPLRPGVRVRRAALADDPEAGRAHAAFYDPAYFAEKRAGGVTVKYRRAVGRDARDDEPPPETAECRVVLAGPAALDVVPAGPFLGPGNAEPRARPHEGRPLEAVVFRNHPPFTAQYDGHRVHLDFDRSRLAAAARAVEDTWAAAFGRDFLDANRGSMLYLTKYFTPHPPGEPHFFVKPWALTRTPPGWSSLLEGIHGDGYDVLRGVVATDVFHATPAVFRLHGDGRRATVPAGAPLLKVVPVPRALLGAGGRVVTLPDAR